MKKNLIILLSIILSVTGFWYAVRHPHGVEGRSASGPSKRVREKVLAEQYDADARSKSFPVPGNSSPARSKAIGPTPGVMPRDREGFAADIHERTANAKSAKTVRTHNTSTDPDVPGNTLQYDNWRVGVEGSTLSGDAAALDVVLTPLPQGDEGNGTKTSGLTYEQELFRTKWGWKAFEQVQRAARDHAATFNQ